MSQPFAQISDELIRHLISKYERLLTWSPQAAEQLLEVGSDGTVLGGKPCPTWYVKLPSGIAVNSTGITHWVNTATFTSSEIDFLMDKPLSRQLHEEMAQRAMSASSESGQCVGQAVNPFVYPEITQLVDPYLKALDDWEAFQDAFLSQRVWAHPLVQYAHWRTYERPEEDTAKYVHIEVLSAMTTAVAYTMPKTITIGLQQGVNGVSDMITSQADQYSAPVRNVAYPFNSLLTHWVRQGVGKNHRLIVELAALLWMYYVTTPLTWGHYLTQQSETLRSKLLIERAVYIAYTAFSHELLRVYPQLDLLVTDAGTHDQIQMEHDLICYDLEKAWQALITTNARPSDVLTTYQAQFEYGYSPVDQLIVTPEDLEIAGVDVVPLKNQGLLTYVFNSACLPKLLPVVKDKQPFYKLYNAVFHSSHAQPLLTHADQLSYQSLPSHSNAQRYEEDNSDYYPVDDVYRQFRTLATRGMLPPVRAKVLHQIKVGINVMNPAHHHLGMQQFGRPAFQPQQASMQDTPCHARHMYLTQSLYIPGNVVPITFQPNMQSDALAAQIKGWQDQNATRGAYLFVPLGAVPLNVLFFGVHAQTGLASIVVVDPTYDGHPSLAQAAAPGSAYMEVPPHLLPGVRQNCNLAILVQQGGVPLNNAQRNLQMQNPQGMQMQNPSPFGAMAMVTPTSGFSMQQLGPQVTAHQAPAQLFARHLDELITMPNGALFDDGENVWRRMARASEGYVLHCASSEFKKLQEPVAAPAPQVIKLVQPAPNVIEVVQELPTLKRTALSFVLHSAEERGYLTEQEHVDKHGGNSNPTVGVDAQTKKPITLEALLTTEKYLKDAKTFVWTAMYNSPEWIRWRKQYNAASCDWFEAGTVPAQEVQKSPVQAVKPPEPTSVDIDTMIAAIQARGSQAVKQEVKEPEVETLDEPMDDFSITSDTGITSPEPEVKKVEDEEVITLENIFDRKPGKPITMVTPGLRRGWRIQVKVNKSGVKRLEKLEDKNMGRVTTPFTGCIFADSEPTLAQLQATESFCKSSPEYQEPFPGAPLISVEPVFTNTVGQGVDVPDLVEQFSQDRDYATLQEIAMEQGLETTLVFNIEPSARQDGIVPIVSSVQEAAAQLEASDIAAIDMGESSSDKLYPAAYGACYDIVQVVGGAPLARIATYLATELEEKFLDVAEFNQWFDKVGNATASSPLHIEMCGTMTDKESQNLFNYAGMCQFNTLLTKRVNQALHEQLGLELSIVNYQQQYKELRKRIREEYDIGGLAAVWTKLENDVILSTIEDLKSSEVYTQDNEQFVSWSRMGNISHALHVRKSVVIKVAATLDDIDIQLSEFGIARSAPEDRSEILASLLRSIGVMTDAYEVSFMDTPTQLLDIYLHLLDGVILKLYRHPSHTTDNADRVIWMMTQV